MALGDAQASDNSLPQGDAGALQQHQASLAGVKMVAENPAGGAPVGNAAMVAGFPETAIANPNTTNTLPATESVSQLVQAGAMQHVEFDGQNAAAAAPVEALKPGESPQVTVTYPDTDVRADQRPPDFIVKQDGTIQATGDPAAVNQKDVVIQVERPSDGTSNPSASQEQSLNGLVGYLKNRYSAEDPGVALKLNDNFGLVSPEVATPASVPASSPEAAGTTAANRQNFAPSTQQAMSQGSRFTPGSSGSVSRGDINNMVPERSQPMAADETRTTADIKNAIAGEFRPEPATKANPNAPYETSRMDRVGNSEVPAVGRYGMSYNIFRGWFSTNSGGAFNADFDFDDDTIATKMDALAKHGKVSKAFAAKFHNKEFAHRFVHAMHEMKEGHQLSSADVKDLIPPQFQEQVAADVVGKFATQAGNDAGKVALAFHLGKQPSDLTAAETSDPGNIEYQRTANTFAGASHLRDGMGANGVADYSVSANGALTPMDQRLKAAARSTAAELDSVNYCARGVHETLHKIGIDVPSGDAEVLRDNLVNSGRVTRISREEADRCLDNGKPVIAYRHWQPGVIREWGGQDIGHITVRTSPTQEFSDHQSTFADNNPRYVGSRDEFYIVNS